MSDSALQEAEQFLYPVLSHGEFVRAKTVSIVDKIFEEYSSGLSTSETKIDAVVGKGIIFLERIQRDLISDKGEAKLVLETPALRRTIDALLDLVSLEGIYPRLLSGVGAPIERRVRSVLQGGVSVAEVKDQNEYDDNKLAGLVDKLYLILISSQGIALAIQQRTLVDVLAALLQLAYGPSSRQQDSWSTKFNNLIDRQDISSMMPHVTIPLSLLPMRVDGVRQTITFVAKSTPQRPVPGVEPVSHAGEGPSLPLEVLSQVSKVLSSIPGTIGAEEYFDSVAPQLYTLLEDQDQDAQRAAAYTISHGVLSKRALGAPGTVGWQYFAEPLLVSINLSLGDQSRSKMPNLGRRRALTFLNAILSIFPNPALSKRLLSSIALPLWQISCSTDSGAIESKLAIDLLKLYFHTVVGSKGLQSIADNLMLGDNAQDTNRNGLVQDMSLSNKGPIQSAWSSRSSEIAPSLNIDEITRRSIIFMELVKACPTDREMGEFFATVLKVSLRGSHLMQHTNGLPKESIKHLIYTHIAQAMIKEMGSQNMTNASIGLFVVEEVLRSQISTIQSLAQRSTASVTRSSLETIVQNNEEKDGAGSISELENTLSICLPWLTVVLQQETPSEIEGFTERVASVQVLLETFLHVSTISRTTKQALRSTIALLSEAGSGSASPGRSRSTKLDEDIKLHADALKNLQATEIPIRVQGLSELERLVLQGSSLVSVSSAVLTVLALLQDQDSFVYLSAVKTLVKLAKNDPQSTMKTLQEAYQDITEQSSMDVRLRTGEAIQTIIEEIGKSLPVTTVTGLVELLLHMSSRRALRKKTNMNSNQFEISSSAKHLEDDADSEVEVDEMRAERDAETVLKSWQGKSGAEDLRLRTSALNILSTIFEYANFSITGLFLKPTLELVIRILNEEKGQQNAIIRRAATMTVLSMVKGTENSQTGAVSVASSAQHEDIISLQTIDTLFATIAVHDEDEIVRGHAEELVKAVQEWRDESFARLLNGDNIKLGITDDNGNVRLQGIDLDLTANTTQHSQNLQKVQELD